MNDQTNSGDGWGSGDAEHTQPISPSQPQPPISQQQQAPQPDPTRPLPPWQGPQQPAYQHHPQQPAYLNQPQPQPKPPRGRLAGWVWPAIATMALLLGLGGGFVGGWAFEAIDDDTSSSAHDLDVPELDGTSTDAPLPVDNASISAVADKVLPSTVQIIAEYDGEQGGATGSGFVLDDQGHIVTNNHVVADSAKDNGSIEVVDQEGNTFEAKLVGRSPVYDLAVLRVDDAEQMQPVALGSSDDLRIGDAVVAIGSPLGLTSTVTSGIVSAKHRPVTTGVSADDASYIDAVQTDAAINPGNSGGPLVNLSGQVVGVNSAIATTGGVGGEAGNIGVGFAIPIEQVRTTAAQILADGEAQYPVIGATLQTGGLPQGDPGATIKDVAPGTPAEKAGLKGGDVVIAVNGERVTDGKALIVSIRTHQPGDTIELTYQRGGKESSVDVTLDGKVG